MCAQQERYHCYAIFEHNCLFKTYPFTFRADTNHTPVPAVPKVQIVAAAEVQRTHRVAVASGAPVLVVVAAATRRLVWAEHNRDMRLRTDELEAVVAAADGGMADALVRSQLEAHWSRAMDLTWRVVRVNELGRDLVHQSWLTEQRPCESDEEIHVVS